MSETPSRLSRKRVALELRGRVVGAIRSFFRGRGYLEVETPVRVPTPAMEPHIDAEASGRAWLRTSPELHMKRLVCAGYGKIFQIGPCFRQGERGSRHLPEYTMLEWYRADADSGDLVTETSELLTAVCADFGRSIFSGVDLAAPPCRLSVRDAFRDWAGWDPVEAFDSDRFDVDLVERVEPRIADFQVPVVLEGFPAERSALASLDPRDPRVALRWELYLGGMELANAYTELTEAAEQRRRFEDCGRERAKRGQEVYPLDEPFLAAMEQGMSPCAGIALGIDRLLMVMHETTDISDVVAFA